MKNYSSRLSMTSIRLAAALLCYLFASSFALAQNTCTTTQKDLAAWWKMDEASGNTASDASGQAATGQFVNPKWGYVNRAGNGAVYLSAGGYMRAPSLTWQPTAFSVAWWVFPLDKYNYNLAIGAMNGWGSFLFHTTSGGAVYVGTDLATRLTAAELPDRTVQLGKWYHFVFTFDNGVGRFYKNGKLLASRNNMAMPRPWGGFTIGGNASANEPTAFGGFDDVRIYKRALTGDEVATLASGVNCPAVPLAAASPTGDAEYNWSETISYNRQGAEIGSARQYVDEQGRTVQTQVNDHASGQVLASQPVYDALGRPVISTLPAPINNATFRLKKDFATSTATPTQPYGASDFDVNPNNPTPISASTPGTLGWYYSANNTLEPDVASTGYPYTRTEIYSDGTGEAKRISGPGEALRAGSAHETSSGTFGLVSELDAYAAIRAKYFPNAGSNPTTLKYHGSQSVATTPQGLTTIALRDEAGRPVVSALPNTSSQAWLQVANSVTLSQERYAITATLGQATTLILNKIEAPNPINVRVIGTNNSVLYSGLNTDFISYGFTGRGYSSPVSVVADSYFTIDYTQDGYDQLYDQPAVKPQSYAQHQFYLLAPQQVTVTALAATATNPSVSYKIVDLRTAVVVGNGTGTSTFSLGSGFYKLVCEAGSITVQYTNAYEQLAFNFYDQRGRLAGSLSPLGTKLLLDELRTTGNLATYAAANAVPYLTTYEYDIQGRLVARTDPDGGRCVYAYRADGKIRFTQNSKQAAANKLAYVNYDPIGRAIESGEYACTSGESFQSISTNAAILENTTASGGLGSRQQFTLMTYDQPVSTGLANYIQEFTAGHLATSARFESGQPIAKTWFSYDELGRVKWLVRQVSTLPAKTIDYTYNELGTIATVCYQQNAVDERFTHYYSYDANRRLTKVETNQASPQDQASLRTVQGRYSYYLHGPLKRLEVGDDLQGVDYAYTAQGWLKNINNPVVARDPGLDGAANNRLPDLFSQSLEYYGAADYNSARTPAGVIDASATPARYDGNIRAATWNISGNPLRGQVFDYNAQNQLKQASYGLVNQNPSNPAAYTFTQDSGNRYAEDNLAYDANGNTTRLRRTDGAGLSSMDAQYDMVPGTNQLDKLRTGTTILAQYGYSPLGEVTRQSDAASGSAAASERSFEYNASGRLKTVSVKLPGSASFYTLASYTYDEQGYRISERTYPDPMYPFAYKQTYYVRDGSGNILATYFLDSSSGQVQLREQIVYGATRLGVFRRAYGNQPAEQLYEHYDHLGNTRVVYRRPTKVTYQLTMEDSRVQQEKQDFPDPSNDPGLYTRVRSSAAGNQGSSYSISLNGSTASSNSIGVTGPSKTLTVSKGDKINLTAYAYYPVDIASPGPSYPSPSPSPWEIALIGGGASTNRVAPPPTETNPHTSSLTRALSKVSFGISIPLIKAGRPASLTRASYATAYNSPPSAALRYVFTGTDGTTRTETATVSPDAENAWEQLMLSTDIDRPGTLTVSVISYDQAQVYFDDLTISQDIGPIVQESNFYAYGTPMPGLSWARPDFQRERSGYQGLYAQYDEETKLNSFLLRMYDPRVGRWLSKDPYGQHASPYTGMGNNPINRTDSNGGFDTRFGAWLHKSMHGGSNAGDVYKSGNEWLYARQDGGSWVTQKSGPGILSEMYNSDFARTFVFRDEYQISISGSLGTPFFGIGKDATLVFFTRGDYAWRPYLSTTTSSRWGSEASAGLTVGSGSFHGPVKDIVPSSMTGTTVDASVGLGIGAGVALGLSGKYDANGYPIVAWDVESFGVKGEGDGFSVGKGETEMYDIIDETKKGLVPYQNAWDSGMRSLGGINFIF